IPLSARLQSLMAHHFALQDTIGLTPRAMQLLVKRVANRPPISRLVTPHVLRHTFAVTAVQKGISLPALQRLLGHDRLTTTEIYLNLSPEDEVREFREKWGGRHWVNPTPGTKSVIGFWKTSPYQEVTKSLGMQCLHRMRRR